MQKTPLVAVIGACGGAGASAVAAALAQGLRRSLGRGVLVDLDSGGAGIDVLLGVEEEPGARWPELAGARGEVDGRGLLAALPRWGAVPVLSAARSEPSAPADEVVLDVCAALLGAGEAVVVDLPRPGALTAAARALLADADRVLLVAPSTFPGAAGAIAAARALDGVRTGPVGLVVRGAATGRVDAMELQALTGLDVVAQVGEDRSMPGAVERGEGPRVGRGTRLGRLGAQLAELVGAGR